MANKKQKKLKKNLSTVKGQLTKTEKKLAKSTDRTERWKKEAKAHKKSAAKAGARADLLAEQLDEASKALQSAPSQAEVEAASADEPGAEGQTLDGAGTPDKDWSVVQLRAEARARGLSGLSRASKADLIAALT